MNGVKSIIKHLILSFLRGLKLGPILTLVLSDYRHRQGLSRVMAKEGVKFGPESRVNNLQSPDQIHIGKNTLIDGELLVHDYGGKISIGEYTYVGLGARVWSGEEVKIGNHVFLAHNVNITDTNSHQFDAQERKEHFIRTCINHEPFQKGSILTAPVEIHDHAWINFGAAILKGVKIGEGAVVGAMSLVTKDVPPYTLVAGNPARTIRSLKT